MFFSISDPCVLVSVEHFLRIHVYNSTLPIISLAAHILLISVARTGEFYSFKFRWNPLEAVPMLLCASVFYKFISAAW